MRDLASYEEARAAWILEAGEYLLRLGTSSRETHVVAKLSVPETIICQKTTNCLSLRDCNRERIAFLSAKDATPISYPAEAKEIDEAPVITLRQEDITILSSGNDPAHSHSRAVLKNNETSAAQGAPRFDRQTFVLNDVKRKRFLWKPFCLNSPMKS